MALCKTGRASAKRPSSVDTHAGEPMRVITGGVPHIPGSSVFKKMKWLETEGDDLRIMLPFHRFAGHPPIPMLILKMPSRLQRDPWTGTNLKPGPALLIAVPAEQEHAPRWPHWHAKGQLKLNEDFNHEGLLETIFTGRFIKETAVGPYQAVVPTLSGQAWITGFNTYVLDPSDPFPEGFRVGDIGPM